MNGYTYQIIIILSLVVFAALWCYLCHHKRHAWYIKRASVIYRNITTDRYNEAQTIQYLRHINPYVFEELLLLAFEKRGYRVIRNSRYTGDGGVDGRVIMDGHKIPVQAKRYKSHIRREHVREFSVVVSKMKAPYGFFIHTGKTGKGCRDMETIDNVCIISGHNLLDLLKGNTLPYYPI